MKDVIKKEKEQVNGVSALVENEIRITTWEKVVLLSHCFKKSTLKIDTQTDKEIMITFSGFIEDSACESDCQKKEEIWIKTVKYKAL